MDMVKDNCDKEKYYNISHRIYMDDLYKDGNVGICYKRLNRYEIAIDEREFDHTQFFNKRATFYHEMSHCIFGIDHSPYINNYMYYIDTGLMIPDLKQQVIRDIKDYCK